MNKHQANNHRHSRHCRIFSCIRTKRADPHQVRKYQAESNRLHLMATFPTTHQSTSRFPRKDEIGEKNQLLSDGKTRLQLETVLVKCVGMDASNESIDFYQCRHGWIVGFVLFVNFWQVCWITQAILWFTWIITWSIEEHFKFVHQAWGVPCLARYIAVIVPLNTVWIKCANILHESILNFLIGMIPLTRKRAKHPIPNDQHAGIILVNAKGIAAVVYSMIRWSIEDVFERRAHILYRLGMNPELVRVIDTVMREKQARMNSKYRKRDVEQVGKPVLHCRLTQRR